MNLRAVNIYLKEEKRMKKIINALLIDDTESVLSKTKQYFSSHAVINIKETINNGKEGLEYILKHQNEIDIILMDIIMPEVDGISILEEMQKQNINKSVIVLTSYSKDSAMKLVREYNIDYFMPKPINMEILEKRILSVVNNDIVTEEAKDNKIEIAISRMLHSLGIPSHIRGYQYIRESVYMMYENPDMIGGITKCIYPEIANRFDTTASRVERAIRHAIEVSWARGDYDVMEELFGNSVDFDRSKPTNSEFIATLADNLRLKNKVVFS